MRLLRSASLRLAAFLRGLVGRDDDGDVSDEMEAHLATVDQL